MTREPPGVLLVEASGGISCRQMIQKHQTSQPQGPLPQPLKSDVTPKSKGWGTLRCPGGIRRTELGSRIPELMKGESHLPSLLSAHRAHTMPSFVQKPPGTCPVGISATQEDSLMHGVLPLDRACPVGPGSLGILGCGHPVDGQQLTGRAHPSLNT